MNNIKSFFILSVALPFLFQSSGLSQDPAAIDSLKQLINPDIRDTAQIRILSELADLYFGSQPDSAAEYHQKALEIARKIEDPLAEAESLRAIGTVFRVKGEYDSALYYYALARPMLEEVGDKDKIATCYNNIGYVYKLRGDYVEAIDYFYKALEIAEELGEKRQMARTYNNIGTVHQAQGNIQKSNEVYEKALALYTELDYPFGIAISNGNLGNNCFNEGDFEKSLEYKKKALDIYKQIDNKRGISICYGNMSEIYRKLGQIDKAIEYSIYSIDLYEEMGYKEGLAATYSNVAGLYSRQAYEMELSDPRRSRYLGKSIDYGNKAMELAREMKSFSMENASAGSLMWAYRNQGNYEKAIEYADLFIATKDSMFKEEKTKAIQEIETRYETEKKEQQIELQESQLVARDAEIKQQKIFRNSLLGGLGAFAIIVFLTSYAYIQKRKDNQRISEKNAQITEANEELHQLNEEIYTQKEEIETQRDHLFNQKEAITESINYAQRIQLAMLPPESYVNELLDEVFILFKPRDIVSGDFYWFKQVNQFTIIAAADCTGHGVPGAFMSMLGLSFLTEIVQRREITQPGQILNEMRRQIKHSLRQHGQPDETKDGIDMALCVIDQKAGMIQYAGANNPLYIIQETNGKPELKEIKADRMPLGYHSGKDIPFTNHEIKAEFGDTLYLFSDGFIDQKGGMENKKYMSKKFKRLLLGIHEQPMYDQQKILEKELADWMGHNPQVDDIMILGVRV